MSGVEFATGKETFIVSEVEGELLGGAIESKDAVEENIRSDEHFVLEILS